MASTRPSRFDSSIVRKKEEIEELLVFGYSCKLFRDDEKALFIDQGKHLIPWMGDDALKIDRYDVRGTVYDLRPLEPLGGGASDALWSSLSDAERKVEQLCDEERYRALYRNEAEEAMYQEEELKRLHKALDPQNSYGQVAYSYDNEAEQDRSCDSVSKEPSDAVDEEDEPFIPPQELDIPVGMVLPERTKLNAIIEKTAAFISTQGPQMEIILKMKQASNPQFSFLSFDCPLHPYYRHVLMAIKTGRYRTKQHKKEQEPNADSENSEHYLHPSLATSAKPVELAPCIPSISYKPSADCAYSMLVNKIKDRHIKLTEHGSGPSSPGEGIGHDDNTSDTHPISAPPPDIQVIIDKMASYVLKNGRDFESVVRSKGDERFAFLDIGHKYHPYYKHKVSVYRGLEHPLNFNKTTVSASNTAKRNQSSVKKPLSPEKKQRPILLPGYEYSDDSSESDEDPGSGESRGKLKIAPVSFSIKKPKEAEILKDVKSALPVEEESSEGEAEVESDATPKVPTATPDIQATHNGQENGDTTSSNPEEEMKRLQQLLKEKELQLREKERLRKISEKRSQDIFQIEAVEASAVPPLPTVLHPPASSLTNNIADGKTDVTEDFSQKALVTIKDDEYNSRESSGARPDAITDEGAIKLLVADKIVNEIAEAEVIDLTEDVDDLPKVSDTTRLERKRKAAAFLSRLQTDHRLHKNGNTHQTSDSDATSRHSTPSPTRLKRDKVDTSSGHFHEASIPRTSLMTRLAASTHMPRQPGAEKPSISKENARSHQKSESPAKPQKEREDRPHYRHKSRRRKSSSPSDVEDESPRALSRSMSYSRSPSHKRRQGEESDLEHRSHRHHKGDKSSRRKRQDTVESAERHHRRHGEERRGQQSYSLSGRGRDRGGGRERGHGHCHSKKIDMQVSDSDSSN